MFARRCFLARCTPHTTQTFTKWANNHIVKTWGSAAAFNDLETDFESGEKLMQLVNSLYGTAMPAK